MKRTLSILSVLFAITLCATPFVSAETFDLSSLSYDELIALKDQINLAIWNSQEWQEVTVPQGVWKVGEDIPAGHWTIKTNASHAWVRICTAIDSTGKEVDVYNTEFLYSEFISSPYSWSFDADSDRTEIDFDLKSGYYVVIDSGSVIFSPFVGKPSLGFK